MNFFSRLLPTYSPPQILGKGSVAVIRDRILQALLLGLSSLGLFAVVAAGIAEAQNKRYYLIAVYAVIMAWVVFCTINRRLPYFVKANSVAFLAYILAIAEFFDTSLLGEVRFWLLVFNVITALLLGFRPVVFSTLLSVLTIAVVSLGTQIGWIVLPHPENILAGTNWLVSSLVIALASMGFGLGANILIGSLQQALIDGEKLVKDLEIERATLETRVQERTEDLQRRLSQVRTSADILSAISQLTDPYTLFQQVVDMIQERMGLYYVGLFLLDETNQYAVLRAGSGEAGKVMIARGHRLRIGGGSMIGWCIEYRKPRIALDVGAEAVRFNNPTLPLTRSELAFPILSRGEALGALTVQSEQPSAFDEDDIVILQGIADGLATAIDNTRLVADMQRNLDEMRSVNRVFLSQAWTGVINDKGAETFTYQSSMPQESSPKSTIDVPVMLRDQTIAHLTLELENNQLSAEEMAFLDAITTQTALALENARLVEESERRVLQEQKLNEMSARFLRAADIENVLMVAAEELGQLPSVSEVTIELIPDEKFQSVMSSQGSVNPGTRSLS